MKTLRLKEDSTVAGIKPEERAAGTVNGTTVDKLAQTTFEGALAILKTGAASGTPDSQSVKLQIHDSADNSSFTAVTGLEVESTADNQVKELHFDPGSLRQYWRPVLVTAFVNGTTPKIESDATVIQYGAGRGPAS